MGADSAAMHFLFGAILLSWHAPNLTPAQRAWCELRSLRSLTKELLAIQASGDAARGERLSPTTAA